MNSLLLHEMEEGRGEEAFAVGVVEEILGCGEKIEGRPFVNFCCSQTPKWREFTILRTDPNGT
jgi:hypothetical protein